MVVLLVVLLYHLLSSSSHGTIHGKSCGTASVPCHFGHLPCRDLQCPHMHTLWICTGSLSCSIGHSICALGGGPGTSRIVSLLTARWETLILFGSLSTPLR
ncbi:hypothetical protein EDC04DRAFT_2739900 [Pisolithus marmoratus]|nr:hypothetical protein EDC04DRAFT_2739900 [Pisolithus marmoratus]